MMFSRDTPKQPLIIWLSFISLLMQNLLCITGVNLQGHPIHCYITWFHMW